MRRISQRDFSEYELKQKTSRWYDDAAVAAAIEKAKSYDLIKPDALLAQRWAEWLSRRGKGEKYIQQSLKKRGLPMPPTDRDLEVRKCVEQIVKKWGNSRRFTYEERTKVYRYLTNRGFQFETVKTALSQYNDAGTSLENEPED